MELTNATGFPALLNRGILDDSRVIASVIARMTYDLTPDGLRVAEEQPWIVSPAPWECPAGPTLEGDQVFVRGGVDVLVFGHARPPGGRPVPRLDLNASLGDGLRASLAVFGDRSWQPAGRGELVPSPPRPFREVPLTLARAYGGKDIWDELEVGYPDNPEGVGFYMERESAVGKPLPNLESPKQLIKRWEDRPAPGGFGPCPPTCGPRLRAGVKMKPNGALEGINPALFNSAFPDLIAPKASPGDPVAIEGVSERGPVRFALPPVPFGVRLQFGDDRFERPLVIDQVGVEPDKDRVFLTFRYTFRYVIAPLRKRSCELIAL